MISAYAFRDAGFSPGSDTAVCIVASSEATVFLSQLEIETAFSGHVIYKGESSERYVGVWGDRNCKRFRRFLRERGASILIHREKPLGMRRAQWSTRKERVRIRDLASLEEQTQQEQAQALSCSP